MSCRRLFALGGVLLLSGCLYHATEGADQAVCALTSHPFDLAPPEATETAPAPSKAPDKGALPAGQVGPTIPAPPTDVRTAALMADEPQPKIERPPAKIPADVPGADTPLVPNFNKLPPEERVKAIRQLYPPLPALPDEPAAQPGPDGTPYTLAELQQIAAGNSPSLHNAAFAVEAARGALQQAWAYPNPTLQYQATPSNDGSTPGLQGLVLDQTIRTGGKQKLGAAAAEKALENARLGLKRARSDLATQVRNAYFGLLVAKETVRVTKAMAHFTDEVYLFQEEQLEHNLAASYDPAVLRAQAWTARLAYIQALQNYIAAWEQLVTAVSLRRLPLSEVAGRIDAFIPYYDYDAVKAYVLQNHTDVLTARNGIDAAKYNLKLAQVTPWVPDVDFQVGVFKEFALPPQQVTPTATVGVPIPLWDQNKGNIRSAEAGLGQALEGPHVVELNLTTSLNTNYAAYRSNLAALEYYRAHILPDQVRAFRGIDERRRFDIMALSLVDLATAQQNLSTSVTAYLGILGSLWTSTVSVADLLQTDDLFQLAEPKELPPLPDLGRLAPLPCRHPCAPGAAGDCPAALPAASPGPVPPSDLSAALTGASRRLQQLQAAPAGSQPPSGFYQTGWSPPQK
jgi:cobalt-zinc-cadmium efflux system outer membrane protein